MAIYPSNHGDKSDTRAVHQCHIHPTLMRRRCVLDIDVGIASIVYTQSRHGMVLSDASDNATTANSIAPKRSSFPYPPPSRHHNNKYWALESGSSHSSFPPLLHHSSLVYQHLTRLHSQIQYQQSSYQSFSPLVELLVTTMMMMKKTIAVDDVVVATWTKSRRCDGRFQTKTPSSFDHHCLDSLSSLFC